MPANTASSGTTAADRVPPQSIEAEISVLGSMIVNPDCVGDIVELLEPESFYRHSHRLIFAAVTALFLRRIEPDVVAVKDELSKTNQLEDAGGYEYIATLVETVPNAANALHYAETVREKFILRRLIQTCTTIIREAGDSSDSADKQLDAAQSQILEVVSDTGPREIYKLGDILRETFKQIEDIHNRKERILGKSTGFHDLDDMLSGFQPAHMYVLAGRPSMGKTSLAMRMIEFMALENKVPTLFFSLEMAAPQISQIMLCAHRKVDSHKLRTGNVSERDFQELMIAAGVLADAPIFIDDSADLNILELRARARRLKAEHGIGFVVVDYLQKMSGRMGSGKYEGREREISIISSNMKSLAKELNLPVLTLAQLNRSPEGREDKKPMLSDLRESGTIEQDADVVMLMYREDYYKPDTEKKNICEVIVTKNRTGPTGSVDLAFLKQFQRFESLSQQPTHKPLDE